MQALCALWKVQWWTAHWRYPRGVYKRVTNAKWGNLTKLQFFIFFILKKNAHSSPGRLCCYLSFWMTSWWPSTLQEAFRVFAVVCPLLQNSRTSNILTLWRFVKVTKQVVVIEETYKWWKMSLFSQLNSTVFYRALSNNFLFQMSRHQWTFLIFLQCKRLAKETGWKTPLQVVIYNSEVLAQLWNWCSDCNTFWSWCYNCVWSWYCESVSGWLLVKYWSWSGVGTITGCGTSSGPITDSGSGTVLLPDLGLVL